MNGAVLAVGRLREKPYREMAEEYLKRLGRFGRYEMAEVDDLPEPAACSPAQAEQLKDREGEELLRKLRPGDYVIALTIGGRQMDSPGLAEHLRRLRDRGARRTVFIVGGSLGLGRNVLARADEELSMSAMTFPHQLARVMLLEQLYRAEKIAAGEKYHK